MKERLFFCYYKQLSKHKTLELQSGTWQEWSYFDFSKRWNRHTDHAGFNLNIEIFGLYFIFQIYDNRHWNYEYNCWEGMQPPPTIETHPYFFNEDGTPKRFVSPRDCENNEKFRKV